MQHNTQGMLVVGLVVEEGEPLTETLDLILQNNYEKEVLINVRFIN